MNSIHDISNCKAKSRHMDVSVELAADLSAIEPKGTSKIDIILLQEQVLLQLLHLFYWYKILFFSRKLLKGIIRNNLLTLTNESLNTESYTEINKSLLDLEF